MELHIVSDGTGMSTHVVTPDGKDLRPVRATIRLEAMAVNEVDLEFIAMSTDIKALLMSTTIICPVCAESMSHTCQQAP